MGVTFLSQKIPAKKNRSFAHENRWEIFSYVKHLPENTRHLSGNIFELFPLMWDLQENFLRLCFQICRGDVSRFLQHFHGAGLERGKLFHGKNGRNAVRDFYYRSHLLCHSSLFIRLHCIARKLHNKTRSFALI